MLALLKTPAEVMPYAQDYLLLIVLGFPAGFACSQGSAVLRAVEDTRAALVFLLISMGETWLWTWPL